MNDTAKGRNIAPHPFPKAEAARCACCRTPLGTRQGYAVPYIGVVGPKCVQKFAALALAVQTLSELRITPDSGDDERRAFNRLARTLLSIGLTYEVVNHEDGSKSLRPSGFNRKLSALPQSWAERREQFMHELQLAELGREGRLAAHSTRDAA